MKSGNYCIYLRKSRADAEAEARGEAETLARHQKALLDLARRNNLTITKIYREIVSGETIAARPVMQQLLSDVEDGLWDGVLVMEVERLARGDTIDQGIMSQTFKLTGTLIITPLKTYDPNNEYDEEYFEFGLFMSRREYKTINRRLQRGRIASVMEGKYVSNKAPQGYRRIKLEHEKGWTLEPIPEEAEVIRYIFQLYTVGEAQSDGETRRLGAALITRRLNSLHYRTKTGGDWTIATVRDILVNPVYIGKVRWNWRPQIKHMADGKAAVSRPRSKPDQCILVDGIHPPIIDIDTWNLAQALIAQNPPRPVGERSMIKNPLAGLVVCGKCGRRMVRRPYSGKNKNTSPTLMCAATNCSTVSSYLHHVESHILSALAEWVEEYRIQLGDASSSTSALNIKQKALKSLTSDLTDLEKQRDSIHTLLEQGVYTVDTFLERSRMISDRIRKTTDQLTSLKAELALEAAREDSRRNIIPKVEHLLRVYSTVQSAKAKNDLLKEVVDKIVYTKDKNGRWHNDPEDFSLTIYPKLPTSSPIYVRH